MYKICSKQIALDIEKMYEISHIQNAIESEYELKCPLCGSAMTLGESNKGGLYWTCSACDYGRGMDQQYPKEGVLKCNECGGNLVFSMKNQPRWVCESNPKHYQIMRYGDLRLEKMAALIPNADRIAVDRYFSEKQAEKEKKKETRGKAIAAPVIHSTENGASGKRAVIQMDDNGNIIAQYDSVSLASTVVGVNNKSIREAANGIQKHAGGYVWKWV